MEEDIRILENLAETLDKTCEDGKCEASISIKNLIKGYRELEESIEHKNSQIDFLCKEYNLMFDTINNLEAYVDEVIKDDSENMERLDGDDCDQELRFKTEIETLQRVKEKLEVEGTYKNYIPKSKVEEKIEELNSKTGGNTYHVQATINAQKRVLQELMEDK